MARINGIGGLLSATMSAEATDIALRVVMDENPRTLTSVLSGGERERHRGQIDLPRGLAARRHFFLAGEMLTGFGKAGAVFIRDARLATSYPVSLMLQWVGIAASVISLWFVSRIVPPSGHFSYNGAVTPYFDFALVNVAFLAFNTAALQSFERSIRDDQIFGTLESTFATPTGAHVIVLASALWAFTITSINVACYLGFGLIFGMHLNHANLVASLLLLALMIGATVPLGILSAAAVMVLKRGAPVQFLLNMAASVLAGVLFPVSILPHWLQMLSWLLPATHALNGIRGALQGATFLPLWPDICWLLVVSVALMPFALWTFRSRGTARRI